MRRDDDATDAFGRCVAGGLHVVEVSSFVAAPLAAWFCPNWVPM
jgi:hypothetical protein